MANTLHTFSMSNTPCDDPNKTMIQNRKKKIIIDIEDGITIVLN